MKQGPLGEGERSGGSFRQTINICPNSASQEPRVIPTPAASLERLKDGTPTQTEQDPTGASLTHPTKDSDGEASTPPPQLLPAR